MVVGSAADGLTQTRARAQSAKKVMCTVVRPSDGIASSPTSIGSRYLPIGTDGKFWMSPQKLSTHRAGMSQAPMH
jgi:hypothetical protein